MDEIIKIDDVQNLVIKLRGQDVLLDRDVATLYGVETKRVNEAVKNNPEKFPYGYLFEVDKYEKKELVEIFDQFNVFFPYIWLFREKCVSLHLKIKSLYYGKIR